MMEPRDTPELVMVVDDDPSQRVLVERWLQRAGYEVETFADGESCIAGLARFLPSAICLDLHMPGLGGMETLSRIKSTHPRLPVIILTVDDDVETVVAATKHGAYDYLVKPISQAKLLTEIRNAVEAGRMAVRLAQLEREVEGHGYPGIVGDAPPMRVLYRHIDRVAASDITVLIYGESGAGKELVAGAIHHASGRRDGPFVALSCAAIPETLQESELFGHERGAFTGATQRRMGKVEQADGGTLFLDEVAELSASLQAKLLRVLQEGSFQRLGSNQELSSDFRLLAATHRDLAREVEAGRFREDLFFRIAVFELRVPPLRERREDIPLLVEKLVREASGGAGDARVSPEAMEVLQAAPWPGNVRELQNALQHAVVVATGNVIRPEDLPSRVRASEAGAEPMTGMQVAAGAGQAAEAAVEQTPVVPLEELERRAIHHAMEALDGNLAEVARRLGIGRTTLYRKLDKYGLRR